jgi:GntR family transcriptional regulator, transcriptional repressor for pyruvate dehydrogenase complex
VYDTMTKTVGSTPAVIERRLTLAILRGEYRAGTHLPTVRQLATRYRVNQATIQRVVARLETRGLIRARQGSGLAVNDVLEDGDLSLVPLQIEAALDDPQRAAKLLEGVLEMRRLLAVRLLVRNRERLLPRLAEVAGDAGAFVEAARKGSDALRAADLAFARRLLVLVGNPVALAFFNTVAKILEEVPIIANAMYAEPQTNLMSLMTVMMALQSGRPDLADRIEQSMAKVDRETVERFETALRCRAREA